MRLADLRPARVCQTCQAVPLLSDASILSARDKKEHVLTGWGILWAIAIGAIVCNYSCNREMSVYWYWVCFYTSSRWYDALLGNSISQIASNSHGNRIAHWALTYAGDCTNFLHFQFAISDLADFCNDSLEVLCENCAAPRDLSLHLGTGGVQSWRFIFERGRWLEIYIGRLTFTYFHDIEKTMKEPFQLEYRVSLVCFGLIVPDFPQTPRVWNVQPRGQQFGGPPCVGWPRFPACDTHTCPYMPDPCIQREEDRIWMDNMIIWYMYIISDIIWYR